MQILRLREKSAIGLDFENANGDYVVARFEGAAHGIHASVLDPCTSADELAIDVSGVHAVNLT